MAKKTPTCDNPELVATFNFYGAVHKIVIFYEDRGYLECWHGEYQRNNGFPQATFSAINRRKLVAQIQQFMEAHGRCLMSNLLEDAEVARN